MPLIVIAEFLGGAVLFLLEDTVEIADIIEAAVIANFRYRCRAVHQGSGGMSEPDVGYIVRKGPSGAELEESGK